MCTIKTLYPLPHKAKYPPPPYEKQKMELLRGSFFLSSNTFLFSYSVKLASEINARLGKIT